MTTLRSCLLSLFVPIASLASQSVLTVGVNGQFADVPAAVAAAQPGDTVRCLQWPPFQLFTAPVITKGIVFDGGGTNGLIGQCVISGIPANETVVMNGFLSTSANVFDVRVVDCAGRVHLDSLSTTTSSPGVWPNTSIDVLRSHAVSLRAVFTHGSPAISVVDSTVAINHCRLGTRAGGNQAGGRCIDGLRSTILITQPEFDAGNVPVSAIFTDQCQVTIAGEWQVGGSGTIAGGSPSPLQFPAVAGSNSTLTLSPAVSVVGGVAGIAATVRALPHHRVYVSPPGGVTSLYTYGAVGDLGVAALTLPALPTPSPFGDLWVDPATLATCSFVLGFAGEHYLNLTVPTTVPVGSSWTLHGMLLTSGGLELTLPATFSIRN